MTLDSVIPTESNREDAEEGYNAMRVVVAQKEDYDRILLFLREHFYKDEPLTIGCEPKGHDAEDEKFNLSHLEHGTCLMILKEDEIIGVAIAGLKDVRNADQVFAEAKRVGPETKWGRMLKLLGNIERSADVFNRFNVPLALHVHIRAVHRNERGKSLGKLLMQELMRLGREKFIPLLTTDCTSIYSARICQNLNMECVNTSFYRDYVDENGEQVFKPPKEHDAVRTYAVLL